MSSQETLGFCDEQGKRDWERWRSTHNKPEPSGWIQVTQGYMTKYRKAICISSVMAVEEEGHGGILYVQTEVGTITTLNCLETYEELMSQLGVKPIELKEVKQ